MPIYEYKCSNGHVFETVQSMADDPLTQCQHCGAPVERVFHPIAVHFKGSGFYTTDYGAKAQSQDGAGKDSEKASNEKASAPKEGKGESKGGDSKPKAKSESGKSESS